jgi:hypothetical protein
LENNINWFVRFWLGLPARKKDAEAVKAALPEIMNGDWLPQPTPMLFGSANGFSNCADFARALRTWIARYSETSSRRDRLLNCNAIMCPMRQPADEAPSVISVEAEQNTLELIVTGGGPRAKPPLDSFLNLVRTVHSGLDVPQEVILPIRTYTWADLSN